jgi:23S rRNA (uracil1939-C5)-methyltransferase
LTGKEKVIDAYCGIGTIGLYAARHAKKVFGIEVVKTAVSDARENARLNDIQNALFEVGEAETVIGKWDTYKFDCIFIDPPRRGCDPKFLNAIIRMKISKVIYISCDQATLARDLKILADGGYRLVETTPVDMFPQTAAIESVSLLELNK